MGNNLISFSAKDLCSRSCMQIKMFNEHPELRPKINENIKKGISFQDILARKFNNLIGQEMRGSFINDNICINFSNDLVCSDKIVEVKSVNKEPEEWYFNSSCLQTAIYYALLKKSNKKLVTSKFYSDLGNKIVETKVNDNVDYYLQFGNKTYKVEIINLQNLINFLLNKANACLYWETAKTFDSNYKHKEFDTLKDSFVITEVKPLA